MKTIHFLIPLLVIISVITSCKKNDSGTPIPPDPSKLLPSVVSYYNGNDSLLYNVYYYYDSQNRIIKAATIDGGVITNSTSYSYDASGNLINIVQLRSPLAPATYIGLPGDTGILRRWHSPGSIAHPIQIAAIANASYDTTNYTIRYTNGLPDSAIVTGGLNKQSINYTITNNKVSSIKINTQTSGAYIYGTPPPIYYSHQTLNFTYSGDDITQISADNSLDNVYTYSYNTHKSAFCNINMKWFLPVGLGDTGFSKHDPVKATEPFSLATYPNPVSFSLEVDYNSVYNEYDYPVQTNFSLVSNDAIGYLSDFYIKYQKYTYIVAK